MTGVQILDRTIQVCEGEEWLETRKRLTNMNDADRARQAVRDSSTARPRRVWARCVASHSGAGLAMAMAGNQHAGAGRQDAGGRHRAPAWPGQGAGGAREAGAPSARSFPSPLPRQSLTARRFALRQWEICDKQERWATVDSFTPLIKQARQSREAAKQALATLRDQLGEMKERVTATAQRHAEAMAEAERAEARRSALSGQVQRCVAALPTGRLHGARARRLTRGCAAVQAEGRLPPGG